MGLHSRIEEKKSEKRGYERDLDYCEEAYEYISQNLRVIEDDIYNPDKAYDITNSGEWLGKLERDADDYRNDICSELSGKISETSNLLSAIERTMEKLRELIRECEEEIEALEEELRARECSTSIM